jgi:hypothetical protein
LTSVVLQGADGLSFVQVPLMPAAPQPALAAAVLPLLLLQLKDLLDGAEAEAASSSAAAAGEAPAGAEQVAEQVEQLQVSEVNLQLCTADRQVLDCRLTWQH